MDGGGGGGGGGGHCDKVHEPKKIEDHGSGKKNSFSQVTKISKILFIMTCSYIRNIV